MPSVPVKQRSTSSNAGRVRPRRDFGALEERRMHAADLFEQGVIPAEIARRVGVSHQIVSDWRAAWRRLAARDCAALDVLGGCRSWTVTNWGWSKANWPEGPQPTGTPMTCGPCNARLR